MYFSRAMCKSKTKIKFGKKENIRVWFYDLGAEKAALNKIPKNPKMKTITYMITLKTLVQ